MNAFRQIFSDKSLIGCIHLLPLPGAPLFSDNFNEVISMALSETRILTQAGVSGLIIENFRDMPFYPDRVPAETISAFSIVAHEIRKESQKPIGINVLRNDAIAALAIASITKAQFIRVNVHMHGCIADQGIILGQSYSTMRFKKQLQSEVAIFADLRVKHAQPIAPGDVVTEALDLKERGLVDAIIISGSRTGGEADPELLHAIKANVEIPVLIGSGTTEENLGAFWDDADGFIVGSAFKYAGVAGNKIDPCRVARFLERWNRRIN